MTKRRKDKKERLDNNVQLSPALINEMRGLIQATRPRSGLRSLTPTQAKVRINELEKEVIHEFHENSKRKVSQSPVLRTQVSGRRSPTQSQLPRQRVPASVRDLFQDAKRALVCSSRQTRREVMHAMRRTGKAGARRNRKAQWSSDSRINCKGR